MRKIRDNIRKKSKHSKKIDKFEKNVENFRFRFSGKRKTRCRYRSKRIIHQVIDFFPIFRFVFRMFLFLSNFSDCRFFRMFRFFSEFFDFFFESTRYLPCPSNRKLLFPIGRNSH